MVTIDKRLIAAASYILFAAMLVWGAWYFYENREALKGLANVNPWLIATAFAVYSVNNLVKGLALGLMTRVFGVTLTTREAFAIQNISVLANYSAPLQGGLGFKVIYLSRVHKLNLERFLSLSLTAFLVSTGIYGVIATTFALIAGEGQGTVYASFVAALAAGSAGTILVPLLAIRADFIMPTRSKGIAQRVIAGWKIFVENRQTFLLWAANVAARAFLEAMVFGVIAYALGLDLSPVQIIVIATVKECSMLLKITPGAFGVVEGIAVYLGSFFGVSAVDILLAVTITRAVELASSGFFASILFRRLLARLPQN